MGFTMKALASIAGLLLIGCAAAACGGGGGGDGAGSRISDPALVPTSTPIQQPLTFRSINDELQIQQGGSAGQQGGTEPQSHTVAAGETCQDIVDLYGVTLEALLRTNRSINADCTNLGEGDVVRIPAATPTAGPSGPGGTPTPTSGDAGEYTVQSGDTCADIAASFGVSADDIIALNGLDAGCTTLHEGDVLQIP